MLTDLSGWTLAAVAVLGVLAVAAGIAVFVVDSMARATFALLGSFLAVAGVLLAFDLVYLAVVTALMMTIVVFSVPSARAMIAVGGVAVVVVTAWSRMYLGVHYPSDVAAGWAAAATTRAGPSAARRWRPSCTAPSRTADRRPRCRCRGGGGAG